MTKFTAINKDEQEIELKFQEADAATALEADKIYRKTFAEQLESGGIVRKKLTTELKKQGLWDDERQTKLDNLQKEIVEKEHTLHKGGISLSSAKDLAISLRNQRMEQAALLTDYNEFDNISVEGQADNARFNYLVYASTVYNDGKRYFESYEDFCSYKDPIAIIAAAKYAKEYYNLDENFESSLPENQFLKKFNFINDDLQLVNENGKLVDEEGHLVDKNGNRVDEEGQLIDIYGNKRNEDGSFADETSPFLDDDGNPVTVDSATDSEEVATVKEST